MKDKGAYPCVGGGGTGCDIPNMAPVENVFRFMEAARKYGRAAAKGEPLPA